MDIIKTTDINIGNRVGIINYLSYEVLRHYKRDSISTVMRKWLQDDIMDGILSIETDVIKDIEFKNTLGVASLFKGEDYKTYCNIVLLSLMSKNFLYFLIVKGIISAISVVEKVLNVGDIKNDTDFTDMDLLITHSILDWAIEIGILNVEDINNYINKDLAYEVFTEIKSRLTDCKELYTGLEDSIDKTTDILKVSLDILKDTVKIMQVNTETRIQDINAQLNKQIAINSERNTKLEALKQERKDSERLIKVYKDKLDDTEKKLNKIKKEAAYTEKKYNKLKDSLSIQDNDVIDNKSKQKEETNTEIEMRETKELNTDNTDNTTQGEFIINGDTKVNKYTYISISGVNQKLIDRLRDMGVNTVLRNNTTELKDNELIININSTIHNTKIVYFDGNTIKDLINLINKENIL